MLKAIECGGGVAHFVVDEAFVVEDFFFGVVHAVEVGEGIAELLEGEVEHGFCLEGTSEQQKNFGADVRVGLRLLEVRNGGAVVACVEECGAEFEAELRVGGVFVNALFGVGDHFEGACLEDFIELGAQLGIIWIGIDSGLQTGHLGGDVFVRHLTTFALKGGVAIAEGECPIIKRHGVFPVFHLFENIGELFGIAEVVGILVVAVDETIAFFDHLVFGHTSAGGGFQVLEFGLIFHQIANTGILVPLLALHGVLCRAVFGAFDSDGIGRSGFEDVVVNITGEVGTLAL